MNTKAAAHLLGITPSALTQLAQKGYLGTQRWEGQPWSFSAREVAPVKGYIRRLEASVTEAAELSWVMKTVRQLQSDQQMDEAEIAPLQKKMLRLAGKLKTSRNAKVRRAIYQIINDFSWGPTKCLQAA